MKPSVGGPSQEARGARASMVIAALVLSLLAGTAAPAGARMSATRAGSSTRLIVGFNIETPKAVESAASLGVNTDILYGGPPPHGEELTKALEKAGMHVIDARPSVELGAYECHRTHTVVPPPPEEGSYCSKDWEPEASTPEKVLAKIEPWLRQDAANPLVTGFWILDDWAPWDGGSGRDLLVSVRGQIEAAAPGYPAICGFAGDIGRPGEPSFAAASEALNFSTAGCSMAGIYNYAFPLVNKRSSGKELDWTMATTLPEELEQLGLNGWTASQIPLLGISQAWGGPFERKGRFMPGLTEAEMLAETQAFCDAGASAIGWYGWTDSGFLKGTKNPMNSSQIRAGVRGGIAACGF